MLHCNELPLRHLLTALDGPTSSKDGFTGPIGRLLGDVNELEINPNFKPVSGEGLVLLPEDVVRGLSTDQHNCYRLMKAVMSGQMSKELAGLKCGSLNHARWLTTAEALLMLWTRKHGLEGEDLTRFESIINFVVNIYFRLYFDIKVKNSLVHGPHHILTALRLLRSQPEEVRNIVMPYVCSGAYHAHSESIILTLLASESEDDRALGVNLIMDIRGDEEYGDISVRKHRTLSLNLQANLKLER